MKYRVTNGKLWINENSIEKTEKKEMWSGILQLFFEDLKEPSDARLKPFMDDYCAYLRASGAVDEYLDKRESFRVDEECWIKACSNFIDSLYAFNPKDYRKTGVGLEAYSRKRVEAKFAITEDELKGRIGETEFEEMMSFPQGAIFDFELLRLGGKNIFENYLVSHYWHFVNGWKDSQDRIERDLSKYYFNLA